MASHSAKETRFLFVAAALTQTLFASNDSQNKIRISRLSIVALVTDWKTLEAFISLTAKLFTLYDVWLRRTLIDFILKALLAWTVARLCVFGVLRLQKKNSSCLSHKKRTFSY